MVLIGFSYVTFWRVLEISNVFHGMKANESGTHSSQIGHAQVLDWWLRPRNLWRIQVSWHNDDVRRNIGYQTNCHGKKSRVNITTNKNHVILLLIISNTCQIEDCGSCRTIDQRRLVYNLDSNHHPMSESPLTTIHRCLISASHTSMFVAVSILILVLYLPMCLIGRVPFRFFGYIQSLFNGWV